MITLRAGAAEHTVVVLGGIPGAAFQAHRLAAAMDQGPTILGVDLPGLAAGELMPLSIPRVARRVADLIDAEVGSPAALIGVSFGGLVGYAVASELVRRGIPAGLVVIGDSTTPKVRKAVDARLQTRAAQILGPVDVVAHTLGSLAKLELRAGRGRRRRGIDHRLERARRLDFGIARMHRPASTDLDLVVLTTPFHRSVTGEDDLGWSAYTSGRVRTIALASEHNEILRSGAPELAAVLSTLVRPA